MVCTASIRRRIKDLDEEVVFPKRVKIRCPAIMLAESRTARVIGRITLLIVSIITMNGIKILGVLIGTKCANICFILLIHP